MLDEDNFFSEATEAAIDRISDYLKHPDDLTNKFAALKKKLVQERGNIDAQLKTAAESQFEEAQKGLNALQFSKNETLKVKQNLTNIDKFCSDAQASISNYDKIKRISTTHQNFLATKEMVEQFQQLNSQIYRIKNLLQEDSQNILGSHDNILFVHHQLFALEDFRNRTLRKAKSSPADVLNTLHNYFKKIDVLILEFEDYLWSVARNTLELVKNKNRPAVVRMVKIIELEEKADEEAALMENSLFSEISENPAEADLIKPRTIKSYRIKFFDVLREGIVSHFKKLYEGNKSNLQSFLDGVDVVVDDLILVFDELAPCFPSRYNIFQFFVLEYHRIVYEMINKFISGSMEGGAILKLLKWVRDYYQNMSGRLGVGEELLEPRLLDGREEELMSAYVKLVQGKLNEWLHNLLISETKEFLTRDHAPDGDATGIYMLSGSVIVFQMFNQQIDVAASSSKGPLMKSVVFECVNTLIEFQQNWLKLMDSEYKKFETKASDLNEGLPEYIMALANDCYRSTEFSETMCSRLESVLDEPWRTQAIEKVKQGSDGFMNVAKKAYQMLLNFAITDSKRGLVLIHCSQWYEQDIMRMVIATYEDYCNDYQAHLSDYLFSKLTSDLLDKFVLMYIETFKNKGAKFKMPHAPEKMKKDLALVENFFLTLKPEKRVKKNLTEIVEKIINFIEANFETAFLDFYTIWKSFPDIPLAFIEDLLSRRDDLSKSQVKEIMLSCNEKVKDDIRSENFTPSVFSKLKLLKLEKRKSQSKARNLKNDLKIKETLKLKQSAKSLKLNSLKSIEERQKFLDDMKFEKLTIEKDLIFAKLNGIKVFVDLSFTKTQSLKECNSILKQLSNFYGSFKNASRENKLISLHLTHYSGEIQNVGKYFGVQNWFIFNSESNLEVNLNTFSNSNKKRKIFFYLTPDAEETLPLNFNEFFDDNFESVFIIGGIVDRSVRKNETLNRKFDFIGDVQDFHDLKVPFTLCRESIKFVKLPLKNFGYKNIVLNIDTVLHILNDFFFFKNWETVLEH
ncbi:SNARE-binding exocyst subunit S6, partial [Clydaea vesicula]